MQREWETLRPDTLRRVSGAGLEPPLDSLQPVQMLEHIRVDADEISRNAQMAGVSLDTHKAGAAKEKKLLAVAKEKKSFCYLIQTAAPIDVSHLKTGDSEVLQLVWQERVDESEGIVFFPNCSLVQGRNRLFEEMLRRYADTEFEYAVFMDDDVELEELLDYGINTGHAWRTFERYLTHWRPAVGLPSYQGRRASASPRFDSEVQTVYNFDQIVVAYHWETWPGT